MTNIEARRPRLKLQPFQLPLALGEPVFKRRLIPPLVIGYTRENAGVGKASTDHPGVRRIIRSGNLGSAAT